MEVENREEVVPAVAEGVADAVYSLADALTSRPVINGMKATHSAIARRVSVGSNQSVMMRTEIEDSEITLWSAARVVSDKPVKETTPLQGWGLPIAQVETAELFCAFGAGQKVACLVNFVLPRRSGAESAGRRSRGKQPAVRPGSTNARAVTEQAGMWRSSGTGLLYGESS